MNLYKAILIALIITATMSIYAQPDRCNTLNSAQTETVAQILSEYDASSLTTESASAIQTAFQMAELRGGSSMDAAIKAAGFDPETLHDLAPPPNEPAKQKNPPPNASFGAFASSEEILSSILPEHPTHSTFKLTSPAFESGGMLPIDFTGDGEAATVPLSWTGAPEGTKSFAMIMHHIAPDQTKWYWILYNIPATTTAVARNGSADVGTLGNNSVNGRTEYAPPHSKGPGKKTYIYTIYALSDPVSISIPPEQVNRNALLLAMKGKILDYASISTVYERNITDDTAHPMLPR